MAEGKPWWESNLEWSLEDTLRMSKDVLRGIPQALAAYKLGKASPMDHIEEQPAEKLSGLTAKPPAAAPMPAISNPAPAAPPVAATKENTNRSLPPRIIPPPPPPPPPRPAAVARAVNMDELGTKPSTVAPSVKPAGSSAAARTSAPLPAAAPLIPSKPVGHVVVKPSTELTSQPAPFRVKDPSEITLTRIRKVVVEKHLTLEQLLDPEFCEYKED